MSDVVVTPLEWGDTSYGMPESYSVACTYRINSAHNGGYSVVAGRILLKNDDGLSNFKDVDAAKSAAQLDFERRILSTIATRPPVTVQEAAKVLLDAWESQQISPGALMLDSDGGFTDHQADVASRGMEVALRALAEKEAGE